MEILTWVLDGALQHRDSLGNGSMIRPGEVQIMSAGTGIQHSEFNPSATEPVRFLQIWILPERPGLPPRYEQQPVRFDAGPVATMAGRQGGAVRVFQDATVHAVRLAAGQHVEIDLPAGSAAWVQVARGDVRLGDAALGEGDGAAIVGQSAIALTARNDSEALVFDLPQQA
jgi:redox-sensitive bicupin YhaK (pirin superfamily)